MLGSNVGISPPRGPLQDIEGIQSTDSQTIIQLCCALICAQSKIARNTMFCLSNSKAKQWTALSVIASILASRKFCFRPFNYIETNPESKN